jgi:hypothetical protein
MVIFHSYVAVCQRVRHDQFQADGYFLERTQLRKTVTFLDQPSWLVGSSLDWSLCHGSVLTYVLVAGFNQPLWKMMELKSGGMTWHPQLNGKKTCSKPPSSVSSVHRAMPASNAPRAPSSFPYFRMEFLNARLPMRLDPSFEASGHLHSGPSFAIPMIRPIGFNPHAWLLQSFCAKLCQKNNQYSMYT